MREIKFKAWDKQRMKMGWVENIVCDYKNESADDDYGCYSTDNLDIIDRPTGDYREKRYIELLQYTELKDNHHKEIYDRDIVKTISGIGVVEWSEDSLLWIVRLSDRCRDWLITYSDNIEIIGNVFENKDLLETEYFSELYK